MMGAKRHRHDFTALWTHFGPYGDQTVHYHVCLDERCDRVLIGDGRDCKGANQKHRRKTLAAANPEKS